MADLDLLRDIERDLTQQFSANRRVMSFDAFFGLFMEAPGRHARTAAQYLVDCIHHYGQRTIERPEGTVSRWKIFDGPWDDGRHRVVGQEAAQNALVRLLTNFVSEGRVTRLVLLHGPNGSAKSSLIQCLAEGLEHYSTSDEGAIYRFNWIFPSSKVAKKRLGFGASGDAGSIDSFALLEDEDVDARLPADLRDHPLLLLPKERRQALCARLREEGRVTDDEDTIGEYFLDGDLAPRSRAIFDALLAAYHGDVQRVLQHVQVERFYFSRRYRHSVVTIEPQLHVDAGVRQVTMDQGLQSLPASLRTLSLYEPFGDLVDANRGIIEFNDLLKKPLDAFKYLLATCEKGTVALQQAILHLDVVFLASSNEVHLNAFKQFPDFASFKGRMDLVRMPYLRDYTVEQRIYDEALTASGFADRAVPHSTFVLALWAVLTRLKRPNPEAYPTSIRDVVGRITPLEKAQLYSGGRGPRDVTPEQARELRATLPDMLTEGQEDADYEGSVGASPREMKLVMLNALQNPHYWGVSPLGIFTELRELIRDKTVYDFLKLEPNAGYHDVESFVDEVQDRWLDKVDNELRISAGLVSEQQYEELFARYILHVSYLLKGEKLYNDATGRSESPDAQMMDRLEALWDTPSDIERFRKNLVARVGAWQVDFPGQAIVYRTLFPKLVETLEADYYAQQKTVMARICEHLMTVVVADDAQQDPTHQGLSAKEVERAREVLGHLQTDFGYPSGALRETLSALMKAHY